MGNKDIFRNYLDYTGGTEPPTIYHRWTYISCISAAIGRKAFLPHGHFRVFPNLYIMLIGEPAARKSTSIKMAKRLFGLAGYNGFAADKTTKEKFLLDLEGVTEDEPQSNGSYNRKSGVNNYDATTAHNLWGENTDLTTGIDLSEPREVFIVADEFNEYAGAGNLEFYTTLGNLWDWDSPTHPFTQRLKNSRSVSIYQPTISILAGNTPELFARAFPPEAIGSGFLSRLLLIHGERSPRRITFPEPPDPVLTAAFVEYFQKLISYQFGEVSKTSAANELLDKIYQSEEPLADVRFKGYSNRRFTQLLKLCLVFACGRFSKTIEASDVLLANTILTHAESLMPKALGEFGKSKHSDVTNKIMGVLDAALRPVTTQEIHKETHRDISLKELTDILQSLLTADKIQTVKIARLSGFLPKKGIRAEKRFVDMSVLSQEERDM